MSMYLSSIAKSHHGRDEGADDHGQYLYPSTVLAGIYGINLRAHAGTRRQVGLSDPMVVMEMTATGTPAFFWAKGWLGG